MKKNMGKKLAGLQGFAAEGKQMNGNEKASVIGGLLGETVFIRVLAREEVSTLDLVAMEQCHPH